jgi:CBS domain containing-hemolysin-like protein
MVPRIGIHAIDVAAPPAEALATILRDGHSRLPVFEGSVDSVLGILYTKDLLPYLQRVGGGLEIDLRALLRQPAFVPETKRVDELLQEMRAGRGHMAIVIDEYGGTAGLVTLEDIVEEIVGEIEDEYDAEEPQVERIDGGGEPAFRLHGRLPVDDLRDLFGLAQADEPDEDAYDTVAGLVVHRLGHIPAPGAEVPFRDGVVLRVETSSRVRRASTPSPSARRSRVASAKSIGRLRYRSINETAWCRSGGRVKS